MPPRHRIAELERAAVLSMIRSRSPISRAELARSLNLRPSSVTEFVRELIDDGLVAEIGEGSPNGGRPPRLLDIDRSRNYAVGVTLEPRGLFAALVRWDGSILSRSRRELSATSDASALIAASVKAIEEVLTRASVPMDRVHGIGVGISALVDAAANETVCSSTFSDARGLRLDVLADRFGKPVYLEDIAYLMALGERWFVYPHDSRPLVLLFLGSGVCGAVLEPWAGRDGPRFAAEFGHVVVEPDGPRCGCGNRGCLEALVSEDALLGRAREALGLNSQAALSLEAIAELAAVGNREARRLIDEAAQDLARVTAALVNVFSPVLMVFAGSVIDAWQSLLLPRLLHHTGDYALPELLNRAEIVSSRLGADCALIGSAARVIQAVFEPPEAWPALGGIQVHVNRLGR